MSSAQRIPWLPGRWMAITIAASALIDALLLRHTRLRLEPSWTLAAFAAAGVTALAVCYALRAPATRTQHVVRDLVEGAALFALVSLLGATASYPLAAGSHALVDTQLERIDLGLHFHWTILYALVAHHAWLQPFERGAYLSIFVTPAVLIGYSAWAGRRAEIRLFIATFWLAAVITLALFPLLPAAGPFATLWHGSAPYMPLSAHYQDQVILALRHHRMDSVDVGALHGLVCAPSFHAASAIIYIATAARIAPLRWPVTVLNMAMLLATPIEGTHYLADLLSGVAVACFALWLTPTLIAYATSYQAGWSARFDRISPVAAE